MNEWFDIVVQLLGQHKEGNYAVIEQSQQLTENAPQGIKSLLCISLCQVAMDDNQPQLASQLLKTAIEYSQHDETGAVQQEQIFYLECLINTKFHYAFDKTIAKARGSKHKNSYLMKSIVGDCLYWCGYFPESQSTYASILEQDHPQDFDTNEYTLKFARALVQQQKYSDAQNILQDQLQKLKKEITNTSPDYILWILGELILIHLKQGNFSQATSYIVRIQNTDVSHPYKQAYCNYIRGLTLFYQNKFDEAMTFFNIVLDAKIRAFEKLPSVLYLARIYKQKSQLTPIKELIEKYPLTGLFWEQEVMDMLVPEKSKSIETEEPAYIEIDSQQTQEAPFAEANSKQEISNEQEKEQEQQPKEPYSFPLSAMLLGIESLRKQK